MDSEIGPGDLPGCFDGFRLCLSVALDFENVPPSAFGICVDLLAVNAEIILPGAVLHCRNVRSLAAPLVALGRDLFGGDRVHIGV